MAVTYALPTVCVRPSRLQRLKSGKKNGSDLRKLTPYPDPKKTFPLSDDHDDDDEDDLLQDKHHAERLNCEGTSDLVLSKVVGPLAIDPQSIPDGAKPIEINFTRISKKLRRSPSSPPRPISDRSSPGKRSSLPSLVSSSFDNFNAPPGRPRRNGWIPGEAFVQMNLKDLRSLASSLSSRQKRASNPVEDHRKTPCVDKSHQPSDESSLHSQPYTAIEALSVYSDNSIYSQTSLAYLREASLKSVQQYLSKKPEIVSPKRGRMSRARLFLFSSAGKTEERK